jgi:hypothetical protein
MCGAAACTAPKNSQSLVALDVLVCVLWMPMHLHLVDFVVRPQTAQSSADRAIAIGNFLRWFRNFDAYCTAVASG